MTEAERKAASLFRAAQREALARRHQEAPADVTVSVYVRQYRHDCAAQGGKSVALELREHYVFSPEYAIAGDFHAVDGLPRCVSIIPADRFGWIWTEGRCSCGTVARGHRGRLVNPAVRPPSRRAIAA